MFKILFVLSLITSTSFNAFGHGNSETVKCNGIYGFKVISDFTPEGKPFVSKTITEIYTSKSDDGFMTHIAIDQNLASQNDPEILIDIINSKNQSLKKYRLSQWITDVEVPGKKINKVNFLNFMRDKITEPYDIYANLEDDKKAKIDPLTIPYDAKVIIKSGVKVLCSFKYKYGSISEY